MKTAGPKESPPRWATRLLRWFCAPHLMEEVEGDLNEEFEHQVRLQGTTRARLDYVRNVFGFARPYIIKRNTSNTNNNLMLRHHFLIAIRSFNRHRGSFLINLTGLSTGLASAIFILLWVTDELKMDKHNTKDRQLYQVMQNLQTADGIHTIEGTQGLLAAALVEEMPEVEYAATVVPPTWFSSKGIISIGDVHIKASPQFVSGDYLKVMTCNIIQGNQDNLLPDIHSVAISRDLALKLFHTAENVVGKIIRWNHQDYSGDYHITGLFEELPAHATAPFDVLFHYDSWVISRNWTPNWDNSDPSTFLILRAGTDVQSFNTKIEHFLQTKEPLAGRTLFAQRFSERYLHGTYANGTPSGGRIVYVQLLSIVGFFVLVIACINFINLSTARATRRVKEVGIKKAIGAARGTLIRQYLSESALVCFISLVFAMGIIYTLLPQFNTLTGKSLGVLPDPTLLLGVGLILLLTIALAGSYPALYLSRFNPAAVLKGKLHTTLGEQFARKGLVVFQFAISVLLIVGVVVVYQQMQFIKGKDLGYNKDNIISFEMEGQGLEKLETFFAEVKKIPGVVDAGTYAHNLTGDHGSITLDWEGRDPHQQQSFANIEVGRNFIETMGISYKEGQSPTAIKDPESQIVLNEEAIRVMGLKDPIGKKVRYWGIESEIVGVTKNFNFESLHEPIKPSLFRVYPISPYFIVRIQGGREQETIRKIHALFNTFASGYPFDYKFIDENYQRLYISEQRVSVLASYFTLVAIIVSCLGLFGLAMFTAEKRTKEIGIRKVLGSSVTGIVFLLSADFTKIVIAAIVIALPLSYLMTRVWLNAFAFRIDLHWWYFAGAGLSALLIAWITIGSQTIKAANSNPVKSLRNE